MKVIDNVFETAESFPNTVLTIGSFDGVHCGHLRVLEEVSRAAARLQGAAAVMTMRPHPREFFSPEHAPNLLTSDRKKLELLEAAHVDVVFILPFDAAAAGLSREMFVDRLVCQRCHAREVIVGHDFCFGREALGDFEFLQQAAPSRGFEARQVPPLMIDGERVSSTAIRERILDGDLEQAERFLGRKYSVQGEVISGRGLGVTLGFPTANLKPHHTAIPAQGVYVAEALIDGRCFPAAVNIGIAPTIRQEDLTIEAFLLDFNANIRNREIELIFHRRLRSEKKFGSHEELIAAIHRDVETVRHYFQSPGRGET